MAAPIPLKLRPRDPREPLYHQMEEAPREHVEALLSAYEVVQGLHDRGVLELLRGALGSSDKVLQILVDAANTPEAIRGIRPTSKSTAATLSARFSQCAQPRPDPSDLTI